MLPEFCPKQAAGVVIPVFDKPIIGSVIVAFNVLEQPLTSVTLTE